MLGKRTPVPVDSEQAPKVRSTRRKLNEGLPEVQEHRLWDFGTRQEYEWQGCCFRLLTDMRREGQFVTLIPVPERVIIPRNATRRTELEYLLEQVGGIIPSFLIERANTKISKENAAGVHTHNIPKILMKHLMRWIGSEYAYSNSEASSYENFFSSDEGRQLAQSPEIFTRCRRYIASELSKESMVALTQEFQHNFRHEFQCGPEVAIEELLSGWESSTYSDYLTEMRSKPHSPGLCYYVATERVLYKGKYIRYCFDVEPSIINPKVTAVEACCRLVRRFRLVTRELIPVLYCDAGLHNPEIVKTLVKISQPFVIAGAGSVPLISAIVESRLQINHHLLLQGKDGLLYSFALTAKEPESDASMRTLESVAVVTNSWGGVGRRCTHVSRKARGFANELNQLSDGALHEICKSLDVPNGTRSSMIARLVGATPGDANPPKCQCCSQSTLKEIVADPEAETKRNKLKQELSALTVDELKKRCVDYQLKQTGTQEELVDRISQAMVIPKSQLNDWEDQVADLFRHMEPGNSPISTQYLTQQDKVNQFDRDFSAQVPCWQSSVYGKWLLDLLFLARGNAYARFHAYSNEDDPARQPVSLSTFTLNLTRQIFDTDWTTFSENTL